MLSGSRCGKPGRPPGGPPLRPELCLPVASPPLSEPRARAGPGSRKLGGESKARGGGWSSEPLLDSALRWGSRRWKIRGKGPPSRSQEPPPRRAGRLHPAWAELLTEGVVSAQATPLPQFPQEEVGVSFLSPGGWLPHRPPPYPPPLRETREARTRWGGGRKRGLPAA